MSRVVLVEVQPLDPATRAAVPVRLAGGGVRAYTQDGAEDWLAGISDPPRFSAALGYAEGGWTGGAIPTAGTIAWGPADPQALSRCARLYFLDRRITVRVGDDEAAPPPALSLLGKVAKQEVTGGRLVLTFADLSGDLAKPLATGTFAGTGGLEGDASVKARIKRRSWGRVFNVEGRVLLAASNVYEFGDPARPLRSMPALRDKGRGALAAQLATLDWQGSADATLAALVASVPVRGGGVVAPSIASAKWWTQPSGPLTADLHGEGDDAYAETPAGIAALVIAGASTLALADPAAGVALRPYAAGIHVDDASETAAGVLDRLLGGVSLLWVVEPTGTVRVREWAWAPAAPRWAPGGVATDWQAGNAAPIAWSRPAIADPIRSAQVTRQTVYRPATTRRLGFQRNHRLQSDAEISAAVLADDVLYADGASVAAMQPREAGSDVTARNQHALVTPGAITAAADYLGTILPGQLPATRSFRRLLGAEDVSADTSWTVAAPPGITATIDDTPGDDERGSVTVTAATIPGGALRVGSTYAGVTLYAELDFVRADSPAGQATGTGTGSGSGGAGDGTAGGPASASPDASPGASTDWTPITPTMTVQIGSSGKATVQYQLSYTAVRGGDEDTTTAMLARVVRLAGDGSAAPIGDPATGSAASTYFRTEPPKGLAAQPGSVAFAVTLTGLAAGAATYRIEAASDGSGAGIAGVTGSASVTPL